MNNIQKSGSGELGLMKRIEELEQEVGKITDMLIVKTSTASIDITTVGQNGVANIPIPEPPAGYKAFLHVPYSGTYNILTAFSQESSNTQKGFFRVRYIGYQTGTWAIYVNSLYIRETMLDVQNN